MPCLSRALEWIRAVLPGLRTPGKHTGPVVSRTSSTRPSSEVLSARPDVARRRHGDRHASPLQRQQHVKRFLPEPWERAGAMVRPYVVALGEAPRHARTGAQADPWGDAG